MSKINIVHWNDVYRVTPQKISNEGSASSFIDVTQFAALLDDIRSHWPERSDGSRDGLSLFSGDLFSPSVESTVTRGSHMVPVMNELSPDVSLTGNHDFDFGYPHLSKLVQDTKFPWLLSNVVDKNTNSVPEHLRQFHVIERSGIIIGIIGLVEEDWISTVPSWPPNFKFKDMEDTGRQLSQLLRTDYKCDLIIALTHARIPNDIELAKGLLALSPSFQLASPIAAKHGVDIILGGHDHLYYASKGVTSWEGFDTTKEVLGAEGDRGDVLVIKSGTDFRDLSEFTLELEDTSLGSGNMDFAGKRHTIQPGMPSSQRLQNIISSVLSSVSDTLKAPVCITEVELDLRSQYLRTGETASGNWFADVLRHAYDDVLCTRVGNGSDGVLICGGTLRGDSLYPPGEITLGNILEILPFEDPIVVLELDGEALWDALEAALSKFPAQEGRFPVISGFRVSWDSRRPAGQRVQGIWLQQEVAIPADGVGDTGTPPLVDGEPIKREKIGRTYKIVTREYMAQGHDGFVPLLGHKYIVDEENGQLMSSLVRKYLLGSRFVNRMARLRDERKEANHLHKGTASIIEREIEHQKRHANAQNASVVQMWHHAVAAAMRRVRSGSHYQDIIDVTAREHMSGVDCFNGSRIRRGSKVEDENSISNRYSEDLLAIHPTVDGRLKDEGRS
ncbi:Metallo-dependent phosphatase-like protein [Phlebopus sp. FC_14]|nr:Metallo-dependent phosphatase-like protein [Phlebopus sp. FC_14]